MIIQEKVIQYTRVSQVSGKPVIRTADIRVRFWVIFDINWYLLLLCEPKPGPLNGGYPPSGQRVLCPVLDS